MTDITITVKGRSGTGKSTLAAIIASHISLLGLDVTLYDDDGIDRGGDAEDLDGDTVALANRLQGLRKQDVEVTVKTKQSRRVE